MDAIQYRMQIVPQYHFSAAKAFDYGQSMVLTVGEANERFLGLLEPMGTKPHLLHKKMNRIFFWTMFWDLQQNHQFLIVDRWYIIPLFTVFHSYLIVTNWCRIWQYLGC